ncbi:MAG: DUF3048 domain-containing protein [Clostridiaceae bacterium]|nr:DUF3048 domain-containing protein [Clostridiaceae bacterium]
MKKIISKCIIIILIVSMSLAVACKKKESGENDQIKKDEKVTEKETVFKETTGLTETEKKIVETEVETKQITTEPKVSESEQEQTELSKFAGRPISEADNAKLPLAVMIDNSPDARMHAGIRQADMIFEMRVEGTYTRYLAIFHSQEADLLGPIRSARKYYIERMQEFDAGYAHVGGSSEATEILASGEYNDLDAMFAPASAMWRYNDTGKVAPHNMYSKTQALREFAESRGYPATTDKEGYAFNTEAKTPNGKKAESVEINYFFDNNSLFTYMPKTKTYSLTKDGVEQVDENDQKQFEIVNIIIQESEYHPHPTIGGILTLDHIGEGTGYYISQGQYVPLTWEKQDAASKTKYFVDGKELKLNPGQTWVLVTGSETGITIK